MTKGQDAKKGLPTTYSNKVKTHETLKGPQVEAITKLGFMLGKISRAREIIHKNRMNFHQGE